MATKRDSICICGYRKSLHDTNGIPEGGAHRGSPTSFRRDPFLNTLGGDLPTDTELEIV